MRNNLFLGVAAVALIVPAAVSAQETTSIIRGTVQSDGVAVSGATLTVTNTTQGSTSTATTDAAGNFTVTGLLPGGPYTVAVASAQGTTTVTDIYTVAQQAFELPIDLAADATAGRRRRRHRHHGFLDCRCRHRDQRPADRSDPGGHQQGRIGQP